jgi:hypothetical protein
MSSTNKKNNARAGLTGEMALALLSYQVINKLGWLFRAQPTLDHGIDAHAELSIDGEPAGRILAIQSKGGPSYFRKPTKGGWYHPVSARHATYWLNHSLPVVVVLVDLESEICYWAHVTTQSLMKTGQNYKILVPQDQQIPVAGVQWRDLVDSTFDYADQRFAHNVHACPPSAAKPLQRLYAETPTVAAMLAATFAACRSTPLDGVDDILTNHADWLERGGFNACLSVAHFAQEHGIAAQASRAFTLAAHVAISNSASYLALAAVQATDFDLDAAADIAIQARAIDSNDIYAKGAELYVQWRVGGSLEDTGMDQALRVLDEFEANPLLLSFRALLADRVRDRSLSIRLRERALLLDPTSSRLWLALSESYGARSQTVEAHHGDLRKASQYAEAALMQRREWTDDTVESVVGLARAYVLDHRYADALRHTVLPPDGGATAQEARSNEVARLAIASALQLGRRHLVSSIIERIGDSTQRRLAEQEFLKVDTLSNRDKTKMLLTLIEKPSDKDDMEALVRRVLALALLGVDRNQLLLPGVVAGAIDPAYPELIATISLHSRDPIAARPKLEALAETSLTAAELLIQGLTESGSYSAAIECCETAYDIFNNATLLEMQVNAYVLAGRKGEAKGVIDSAMAAGTANGSLRTRFRLLLAEIAAEDNDWSGASDLYRAAIDNDTFAPASTIWNIVACEIRLVRWAEARQVLDDNPTRPITPNEINMWCQVNATVGWNPADAAHAVELAESTDDPRLAMQIVSSITFNTRANAGADAPGKTEHDARPLIGEDTLEAAHQIMATLVSEYGPQLGVESFSANSSDIVQQLTERVKANHNAELPAFLRQARRGFIPLGVVAQVAHRSYLLTLAQRPLGVRLADDGDPDAHDLGVKTALGAVGGQVIVDASAVELAQLLEEYTRLRRQFRKVSVTRSTRRDAVESTAEARAQTAGQGYLWWDAINDRMRMTENDPAENRRVFRAVSLASAEISKLPSTEVAEPFSSIAGQRGTDTSDGDSVISGSWFESIELAFSDRRPLWSDDVSQRHLARSLGVAAFGTVHLIEALLIKQIEAAAGNGEEVARLAVHQHDFVRRLMRHYVVDLPISLDDVLEQMEADGGHPLAAAAVISRAAWWSDQGSIGAWAAIRDKVLELLPDSLPQWQFEASTGIALANENRPTVALAQISAVALFGASTIADIGQARESLRRAKFIADQLQLGPIQEQVGASLAIVIDDNRPPPSPELLAEILALPEWAAGQIAS